jgi:hypothetical protein
LRSAPCVTPFDYYRLRLGNYADACSLIRTEAYEQVGGWKVEDGGLNDWMLYARGEHAGHLDVPPAPGEFMRISASGFMCTIFRRQVWDALAFRPSPTWSDKYCYYDWAAARDVDRLGWKWMLAGSVRCKHWQADGTFIAVSRGEAFTAAEQDGIRL